MEKRDNELLVFAKAKALSGYIIRISSKSPVKYRYSILNNLINSCLSLIEGLYEANAIERGDEQRVTIIRKALVRLNTIDFLSSLASEVKCFTEKQYDNIVLKIGDCNRYLAGWYKSSKSCNRGLL